MINLKFNKVVIHHFLSYDHAEIDLRDKGYCLVSGINRNLKDASKSNGSGKSTTFNAISYALVGETLQGLKSNLANIYFDDGCYVILDFDVDGHNYVLTRSKDDKKLGTDLKIVIDGQDKSGKGIKESQALLDQYLPDLTSELIGSVIMIGQGMPTRFTANTPAGRKEVLEHLSQSDFMIQDLKDRIATRQSVLSGKVREVEDGLLKNSSQESVYKSQLERANIEYETKFATTPDFDKQLIELEKKKEEATKARDVAQEELNKVNKELEETNPSLLAISKEKETTVKKYSDMHLEATEEFNTRRSEISGKKYALEQEITRLKSIKDVCPTCGQKIPGAVKPDTSKQEEQLKAYIKQLEELGNEVAEDNAQYKEVLEKINKKYDGKIAELQQTVRDIQLRIRECSGKLNEANTNLQNIIIQINAVKSNKEVFDTQKKKSLENIEELQKNLNNLSKEKESLTGEQNILKDHTDVINKFNTIVKRDFRGFLLRSIIDYIDAKAKDYASKIFGCNEIAFTLDGNNIDVSFCGKLIDNLSGGEQQRVNLIVQFAIRDFLCQYLQFSSNILVLDEITDALDSESCDRVINFITSELKDIESVFIISHHADELSIPVDSELKIEKNELGVSNVIY